MAIKCVSRREQDCPDYSIFTIGAFLWSTQGWSYKIEAKVFLWDFLVVI